jgi:predicted ATPase
MGVSFQRLAIEEWRQFRSVDIAFHPRLTVLTGANGAGKTTLLNLLGRHFGWDVAFVATSRLTRKGAYRYFSGAFGEPWEADDEPEPSRSVGHIWYSAEGEASISVPADVGESFNVAIENQRAVDGVFLPSHRPVYTYRRVDQIPTRIDAKEQIFDQYYANLRAMYQPQGRFDSPSYRLKGSLISLATFGYGNEVVEANPEALATFKGFETILALVLPEQLGFEGFSIRMPEIVLVCRSGDFSLDAASGGVAAVIDMAWQVYMKSLVVADFVVVCDEPENHLHPEMQRSIMPGLLQAFPSVQFVIATHNPFVVTSVQDSKVIVLDYVEERVESKVLDEVDRSGSANQILRDVLGVPAPIPLWVESRIDEIVSRYEDETLTDQALQGLRAELREVGLGHLFPDAVAKILQAEQG